MKTAIMLALLVASTMSLSTLKAERSLSDHEAQSALHFRQQAEHHRELMERNNERAQRHAELVAQAKSGGKTDSDEDVKNHHGSKIHYHAEARKHRVEMERNNQLARNHDAKARTEKTREEKRALHEAKAPEAKA